MRKYTIGRFDFPKCSSDSAQDCDSVGIDLIYEVIGHISEIDRDYTELVVYLLLQNQPQVN